MLRNDLRPGIGVPGSDLNFTVSIGGSLVTLWLLINYVIGMIVAHAIFSCTVVLLETTANACRDPTNVSFSQIHAEICAARQQSYSATIHPSQGRTVFATLLLGSDKRSISLLVQRLDYLAYKYVIFELFRAIMCILFHLVLLICGVYLFDYRR